MRKTIHIILNAHIDPAWLWPWQAGLDELLATCRSACDRLDSHPDIYFTRGEAWVYQQIEMLDPDLFERIKRHIDSGRWEIVGGWWLQPDCNQPSGWAMQRQIDLGRRYFESTFGQFPRTGYNVDSFGHAATLPQFLNEAGQDRYIMMRPGDHEMALPARLFRWRGFDKGAEVTTFRIAAAYQTRDINAEHFLKAVSDIPEGINHTMCFVGVGDHGGGPTEKQIAWCQDNAEIIDGWKLEFSTPSRFFDAISDQLELLPLVTGELQQHAIGCYSVYRPIKAAVRRAEHLLRQAEIVQDKLQKRGIALPSRLNEAWERVAFNHFHDILGGTCIPSAYPALLDQVGFASCIADDGINLGFRKVLSELPDDHNQRIVALNASDFDHDGYAEFEPWLDWQRWDKSSRIVDGERIVPYQLLDSEAVFEPGQLPRLLFRTSISPSGIQVLRIEPRDDSEPQKLEHEVSCTSSSISNDLGVVFSSSKAILPAIGELPVPRLDLLADQSDTWSHGLKAYPDGPIFSAQWNAAYLVDQGPLMASLAQTGQIGMSSLKAEWRVYADEPFIDMLLTVHWQEMHKLLKLTIALPGLDDVRIDGIMGGSLERDNDGRELPCRDFTLLRASTGVELGIVCPDIYALDATQKRVRLTLLRSPVMAHHEPNIAMPGRFTVSDQGVHNFRFRFFGGAKIDLGLLESHAMMMQRPLTFADLTRGMKPNRF